VSAPETVRARVHTWADPTAAAGLTFLRRVAAGEIPASPIASTLGIEMDSVAEGRVVFSLVPAEFHSDPIGSVHGGGYAALLDSAAGCAVGPFLSERVGRAAMRVCGPPLPPLRWRHTDG
jgi:acyl-coenzyme A thioesterase PaaI-like protein